MSAGRDPVRVFAGWVEEGRAPPRDARGHAHDAWCCELGGAGSRQTGNVVFSRVCPSRRDHAASWRLVLLRPPPSTLTTDPWDTGWQTWASMWTSAPCS